MPVHLLKIAVGIESLEHFRERMKVRRKAGKTFTHYTRHMPKRAEEVLDGGSLYWIVKGAIAVRCPIVRLEEAVLENKGPHCGIVMKTQLIPVLPLPRRPHQGWRYLEAEDAPPDVADAGKGAAELPPKLLAELRDLGLL
ncbi:DUF1489 domain-containing protein [Ferrovibrio terrae]|uniref:DUF1489 family protein n=1 Tax=Ferrovibrio terrae TaxID=2594003 RepID=UPI0031383CDF